MIDTLLNLMFRCPHRRLTRPITPVSKPGVPSGDTYVVCLDCGKQFTYDWKQMRLGGPVESTQETGVLHPGMPEPSSPKLKYLLLGTALPFLLYAGKALTSKREPPSKPPAGDPKP
jgi:DNA-directed RNA polymerase subunit RPC12/RpoP